ncbi:signal recognition particle-docking protein FtsY [Candidatus Woesearchaeota archaeon]|nr:signal recognition particle-docking protein FtsY [Candidatus Woesearchaeota archaeon]
MFKFFKEKLKKAISKTSDKIEKEGETIEEIPEKAEVKQGFLSKFKEKFSKKEEKGYEEVKESEQKKEDILEQETEIIVEEKEIEKEAREEEKDESDFEKEAEEAVKNEKEKQLEKQRIEQEKKLEELGEKKGIFSKVKEKFTTKKISYSQFEGMFDDLELILLENNVAVEVIDKIKSDLGSQLVEKPIIRNKIEETIRQSLKNSITDLFDVDEINLLRMVKRKIEKPFVIAFLGINGSGKTTTIAKIADLLNKNKISSVLAASDTFRAASIEQLQKHADKLGIKLVRHNYGSDPAAVAFDAINHAKSKNIDVVLIDTAGRMHSNENLIEEMKKIIRVSKPDLKIFVGEAITGNDCVEQAKTFDEAVGIDGIILSKSDIDEKGGASISVSYVTKKPVIYLGTGQEYSDLKPFEPELIIESLGLNA